ncbi:DUF6479 family protein [Streptomyces nojiriensis]|uniref:DUF6479 family protein n=1 Tax=Streptomyces nojiriensis TaxID=66374 RepID=UPI001E5A6CCB|nr:DUF6479 family protein [Streptomyces nojiriensis]
MTAIETLAAEGQASLFLIFAGVVLVVLLIGAFWYGSRRRRREAPPAEQNPAVARAAAVAGVTVKCAAQAAQPCAATGHPRQSKSRPPCGQRSTLPLLRPTRPSLRSAGPPMSPSRSADSRADPARALAEPGQCPGITLRPAPAPSARRHRPAPGAPGPSRDCCPWKVFCPKDASPSGRLGRVA